MKDIFDAEKRYANTLLEAKNFLKGELKKPNGSSLTEERVDYLLSKNAECPICGVKFEGINHNTEHIVPLSIGGKNILENKIQMCVICNHSRNQVMQALFPRGPQHKYYPEKWIDMKQFILWCELSIDEKELAADLIPSVHTKFMEFRTGGEELPLKPKRSFGRASTWKVGDEPNYQYNVKQIIDKKIKSKKIGKSRLVRIADWIFGFEPNTRESGFYESKDVSTRDKVEDEKLSEEHFAQFITKLLPNKESIPLEDLQNNFPIVSKFNTAQPQSLKLPQNPSEFGTAIELYFRNQGQIESTDELNRLLQSVLTRSRRDKMIGLITTIVLPNDKSKRNEKNWSNCLIFSSSVELTEKIRNMLLVNSKEREYGTEFTQLIEFYFGQVCIYLRTNKNEN